MPSDPKQSHMMEQEPGFMGTLPAMLKQMAQKLSQGEAAPDTLHQMAEQMQEMVRHMKGMPGMMGSGSMMHGEHGQGDYHPQERGLWLQMWGEIMQAVGEILHKYGKLLAEEDRAEHE